MHRLTAVKVSRIKEPGVYPDGAGLYLQVQAGANGGARKSWLLRYMSPVGRRREMGLGPFDLVSLAEAREHAREARRKAYHGEDPIDARRERRKALRIAQASPNTFAECADAYITAHSSGWRNSKSEAQWRSSLETYVYPALGEVPVEQIDIAAVMMVLDPIWAAKNETASRVRGRMEAVLDWAAVRGFRSVENPARWKGHLDKVLPARSKVQKVRHHPAVPVADAPAFYRGIMEIETVGARAFAFCILTATRTSETTHARWSEIDLENGCWTLPAERTKSGRMHRVPLSLAALALLKEVAPFSGGADWVFPGQSAGRPLSNMAFLMILRRLERQDVTAHGFRSTFRDWAAEETAFPREVAEASLAHVVRDKAEAAYLRSDFYEKRRELMTAWAGFLTDRGQARRSDADPV